MCGTVGHHWTEPGGTRHSPDCSKLTSLISSDSVKQQFVFFFGVYFSIQAAIIKSPFYLLLSIHPLQLLLCVCGLSTLIFDKAQALWRLTCWLDCRLDVDVVLLHRPCSHYLERALAFGNPTSAGICLFFHSLRLAISCSV